MQMQMKIANSGTADSICTLASLLTLRYPVVVCEILTAEIPEIDEELVGHDGKYLETIFAFFHVPRPQFNILLASLVVKLIVSLLSTHLLVDVCDIIYRVCFVLCLYFLYFFYILFYFVSFVGFFFISDLIR
jgi:hypothetical protein